MRVLVTGLGDIARKGYLPVLSALPVLEVHLATRDQAMPHDAARMFRMSHLHAGIDLRGRLRTRA